MQNIVEYFGFSLMIVNYFIGYNRGGHLEGLKYAAYSPTILMSLVIPIYFMMNYQQIQQKMWDPVTQSIMFEKMPTEIYAYGILFIISSIMAFAIEKYVERKQENNNNQQQRH